MEKITFDEYKLLYDEMMDNLKKQDNNISVIISILGLSNVFVEWIENIAFLFLILFITLIIQLRILANRNVVNYIASYLYTMSEKGLTDIKWEKRLHTFKKEGYIANREISKSASFISKIVSKSGVIMQHFGISLLSLFIYIRIILFTSNLNILILYKSLSIILASIMLLTNFLYTYTICKDRLLLSSYILRWKKILHNEDESE